MILYIDDHKTISDLQEKFSECFPSLKIEFYSKRHHYNESSSSEHLISPGEIIGDIRTKHDHGDMTIKSWYSAEIIERDFNEKFGLNPKIFRKENNTWIHVSPTDHLVPKEKVSYQ